MHKINVSFITAREGITWGS